VGLSERLEEMKPKETGLPCGVARAIDQMTEEDKTAFEMAMYSVPRVLSNVQLQEALVGEGFDISYSSISLHRRRQCRCFIGKAARMAASD
jgi:hypothetical protein